MTSQGSKVHLNDALVRAKDFLEVLKPFVTKAEIAGSINRKGKKVGDSEIVCMESPFNSIENLNHSEYPGQGVNGPRLKRIIQEGVQIDLFIAQPHDYGRIFAIRTGSAAFAHHKLAKRWRDLGWCGTNLGLRKVADCVRKSNRWEVRKELNGEEDKPPVFETEYDFFNFLNIPWIPPEERNI